MFALNASSGAAARCSVADGILYTARHTFNVIPAAWRALIAGAKRMGSDFRVFLPVREVGRVAERNTHVAPQLLKYGQP
jgi:hypothetical protein